jgi:hypothetical protein
MGNPNTVSVHLDPLVKRRVERVAKRLGITVSNLLANVIGTVLPTIEKTPRDKAGDIGRQAPEEKEGGVKGRAGAKADADRGGQGARGQAAGAEESPEEPAASAARGKKGGQ